jgi:hypothetical protein
MSYIIETYKNANPVRITIPALQPIYLWRTVESFVLTAPNLRVSERFTDIAWCDTYTYSFGPKEILAKPVRQLDGYTLYVVILSTPKVHRTLGDYQVYATWISSDSNNTIYPPEFGAGVQQAMADEISKAIDAEILKTIRNMATLSTHSIINP